MTDTKDRTSAHIPPEAEAITSLAKAFARLPQQTTGKARPSTARSLPAVGSLS